MLQVINITDEDILFAESILLPVGKFFDEERKTFIRNFETIDLQAVPGSGKTTALLAKLLILERKLPFEDGSGILVLSHTNSAIDEIIHKIKKHCPKLFSYPNFIGTIQSFTDEYLAIPYGHNVLNVRISWIDKEKYEERLWGNFQRIAWTNEYEKPTKWFYSRHIKRAKQESKTGSKTEKVICNELIEQEVKSLYYDFTTDTINSSFSHKTILKTNTNPKFIGLKLIIEEVVGSGIISYDYAYCLAESYIQKIPIVKILLQKRFRYVFVDEMQDMDEHQYNLLESIFHDEGKSISSYQRIGDKNQAIFDSVKVSDIWKDRELVLPLKGSQRLSKPIADILFFFALHRFETFEIIGLRDCELKPHILLFNDNTIKDVISFFIDLVKTYKESGKLVDLDKYPIKIISWSADWNTVEEKNDLTKIRLIDYHPTFEKKEQKPKQDYDCLENYLLYFDKGKHTLGPIRKNILNALLKVLRIEEIYDEKKKNFTKRTLLTFLFDKDILESTNNHEMLKLNLYNWSIGIIRNKTEEVWTEIKFYIPVFTRIFGKEVSKSIQFIFGSDCQEQEDIIERNSNCLQIDNLNVEVSTVHSAKGQTHCATLYLESYYHQDGKGANAKSYESERLADQFLGKIISADAGRHVKESLKMAYVGFSRATNLLCLAIHEDRFNKHLSNIDNNKWEIRKVITKT